MENEETIMNFCYPEDRGGQCTLTIRHRTREVLKAFKHVSGADNYDEALGKLLTLGFINNPNLLKNAKVYIKVTPAKEEDSNNV